MLIQHSNIFAKSPFFVGTPRTNRNNGCLWEGLQEKIAITSEEGFDLDNQRSTDQSKEEEENSTVQRLPIEILHRDRFDDGLGRGHA